MTEKFHMTAGEEAAIVLAAIRRLEKDPSDEAAEQILWSRVPDELKPKKVRELPTQPESSKS